MFAEGDWIVYNHTGVCCVAAVGPLPKGKCAAADTGRDYYTLAPFHSRETIYIPVDSPVFMRPVISWQEAEDLLSRVENLDAPACITRDLKQLREYYAKFLRSHTCEDLVRLIRSVNAKNRKLEARGGHPRKIDQDYQKRAEELLYAELSKALCQPYDQVARRIEQQIRHTS